MYVPNVPKIRHKVGTQSDTHTFFSYFCIMHLMYVNSEIKFLLNNVQFGLVSLCFIPKKCTLCMYMMKEKQIYNTKYLFIYLI